jgi:ATP-dependent DNA helicase DinG
MRPCWSPDCGAAWLDTTGEVLLLAPQDAARRVARLRPILCHGPATAKRLGIERFAAFDLLELFAFVRPARFCLPTPRGLAEALGLPLPRGLEDEVVTLHRVAEGLLAELQATTADPRLSRIAWTMARGNWPWGPRISIGAEAAGGHGSGLMPAEAAGAGGLRPTPPPAASR